MNKARHLTRGQVRSILSQTPKKGAFMRHGNKVVKPFECGLFELENKATGWYIIGGLEEAVNFLCEEV